MVTEILNLHQAASYARVTYQTIFLAVKRGRLRARRSGKRWLVTHQDVDAYRLAKYTGKRHNGRLVHNPSIGLFSLAQSALVLSDMLGYTITRSRVAWAVKRGVLACSRHGHYYVIAQADLARYAATLQEQGRQSSVQLAFA